MEDCWGKKPRTVHSSLSPTELPGEDTGVFGVRASGVRGESYSCHLGFRFLFSFFDPGLRYVNWGFKRSFEPHSLFDS